MILHSHACFPVKSSIYNFMMENSHQECRIGNLLLLNFSILLIQVYFNSNIRLFDKKCFLDITLKNSLV